jgi:type IV fimbrial biogenesis protein FimT
MRGRSSKSAGVTLIELMIGIAVLGVLVTLALPSFSAYMANVEVRNAADALSNGLQYARSEALRQNRLIRFQLDVGSGWTVTAVSSGQQLQTRTAEEGSVRAQLAITPGGATAVTFNSLGARMDNNADGTLGIQQIDLTPTVSYDGTRALRVVISNAGSIRMCDPDPNLSATDPRRCNL